MYMCILKIGDYEFLFRICITFEQGEDLYSHKLQKNLSDLEAHLRVLTLGKKQENTKGNLTEPL